MKKIIVLILIITSAKAYCQTYVQIGGLNKGFIAGAGYTAKNGIVAQGTFSTPIMSSEVPTIVSISAGYEFKLSHKDADNFTLTIMAGVAKHSYADAGEYLGYANTTTGIYTAELGKDWYLGRLYASASYNKFFLYGLGIKVFLNRH